ncbi:MAG: GNAT family N-acetyltransferase [Candidatus Micrarchaeota archaeon]|nr:GNAT family N-acetyltransferase [Candidatus Micrarchaeota archaeon]
MAEVVIEELNRDNPFDVRETAQLLLRTFRKQYHGQATLTRMIQDIDLTRQNRVHVFIARSGGKIVGVANGGFNTPLQVSHVEEIQRHIGAGNYFLSNLAVHPDFRRRGIAKRLTARRIEHARQLGCKVAYGGTNESSEHHVARKAQFEKEGFTHLAALNGEHYYYKRLR